MCLGLTLAPCAMLRPLALGLDLRLSLHLADPLCLCLHVALAPCLALSLPLCLDLSLSPCVLAHVPGSCATCCVLVWPYLGSGLALPQCLAVALPQRHHLLLLLAQHTSELTSAAFQSVQRLPVQTFGDSATSTTRRASLAVQSSEV